ncbi:MAG: DUF3310 domain-containing protein [Simkaniaceae bacterium]|nr:DUF3310 domain-containing protein [Simkaniaceae bacterium]
MPNDSIQHPSHYVGERVIEPSKVIKAWQLNYHLGNVLKYISRAGRKGDEAEDLHKAIWYLEDFIRFAKEPMVQHAIYVDEHFQLKDYQIALDWNFDPALTRALHHIDLFRKNPSIFQVEAIKKAINDRLKAIREAEKVANDNKSSKKGGNK